MTLLQWRDFSPNVKLPATWTDGIEKALGNYVSPNWSIDQASTTQVRVKAGTGVDARAIMIQGSPRWIEADATATVSGGAAVVPVYACCTADSFGSAAGPPVTETDTTTRTFTLKAGTPSGSGGEALSRKVADVVWDGAKITGVLPYLGPHLIGDYQPLWTALPASPYDGQKIVYAADATGVLWPLRYNGLSASPYKWEAIGPTPLGSYVQTVELVNSSSYVDGTNVCGVTAPLAGEYMCGFSGCVGMGGNPSADLYLGLKIGATSPSSDAEVMHEFRIDGGNVSIGGSLARAPYRVTVAAAATALRLQHKYGTAAGGQVSCRALTVAPVRVG